MISKLPRWVWVGGSVLAFIAGMINAVGLLGFQHEGVTHLTGTTTLAGVAFSKGRMDQTIHLFSILGWFLAGAIISGFLIQDSTLRLGRHYGAALLLESALLFIAVPLLHQHNVLGDYLASCACGLQNAMASTYSGAVIRTTHVTGIFTDIGIALGQYARRLPVDRRKIILGVLLISAFFLGGVLGSIAFERMIYDALYLPAGLTGIAGLSYIIYSHIARPRPAKQP